MYTFYILNTFVDIYHCSCHYMLKSIHKCISSCLEQKELQSTFRAVLYIVIMKIPSKSTNKSASVWVWKVLCWIQNYTKPSQSFYWTQLANSSTKKVNIYFFKIWNLALLWPCACHSVVKAPAYLLRISHRRSWGHTTGHKVMQWSLCSSNLITSYMVRHCKCEYMAYW